MTATQAACLAGTVGFTVYAQLMLKWRVLRFGALPDGLQEKAAFLASMLLDPWMLTAFGAAFLAAVCWMAAMTSLSVSYAYPVVAGAMVAITICLSVYLFHESISWIQAFGIVLIVLGISLASLGRAS